MFTTLRPTLCTLDTHQGISVHLFGMGSSCTERVTGIRAGVLTFGVVGPGLGGSGGITCMGAEDSFGARGIQTGGIGVPGQLHMEPRFYGDAARCTTDQCKGLRARLSFTMRASTTGGKLLL